MRRRSMLLIGILAADLLVFPILASRAAAPAQAEVCYSIPDICSVTYSAPVSTPIGVPSAGFVVGTELLLLVLLGFSGLPKGSFLPRLAAGAGVGGIFVIMLGSSRALISLYPSLTPFRVYSTLTSPFLADPSKYSDATHLYYGLAIYDLEATALLAMGLAGTLLLYRGEGRLFASVRVVRVVALLGSFLAADVAIFDYPEFFIHATAMQEQLHLATWFTNADLLAAGVGVAAATFVLARGKGRPAPVGRSGGAERSTLA